MLKNFMNRSQISYCAIRSNNEEDKYFNLVKSNTINNNILLKFPLYLNNFKFLMIRRKKTLGYIEFIRGRYDILNLESYTTLFEQMVSCEISE